ncbi:hypothetical protein FB107DRAFT_249817 [Schizophyllum commune]
MSAAAPTMSAAAPTMSAAAPTTANEPASAAPRSPAMQALVTSAADSSPSGLSTVSGHDSSTVSHAPSSPTAARALTPHGGYYLNRSTGRVGSFYLEPPVLTASLHHRLSLLTTAASGCKCTAPSKTDRLKSFSRTAPRTLCPQHAHGEALLCFSQPLHEFICRFSVCCIADVASALSSLSTPTAESVLKTPMACACSRTLDRRPPVPL